VALAFFALTAPAFAGVGNLGIYADEHAGMTCITDPGGGALLTMYVVHHLYPGDGATACDFRIEPPASASWTYLAFVSPFASIGNVDTGITVGYGGCQTATFSVGAVLWTSTVASGPCGVIALLNGGSGAITVSDCLFGEHTLSNPGHATANPSSACANCGDIATVPATWGSVKALYR
jgi:hypothetical protein